MANTLQGAKPTPKRWTVAVLSLSGAALVAACGSSGTTGSAGASANSPASAPVAPASATASASASSGIPCAQITALRTSLTDLSHLSVSPASAGKITVDLTNVERELAALKSQGTGAFSAQANQLTAAINTIKKDAQALTKSPSLTNLTNLTHAVKSLKTTSRPLIKEMQTACP